MSRERRYRRAPLVASGLALGIGLGGFVDGIVLHQLLQWHNMLSSRVVPNELVAMKYNMLWDGLFHAVTWLTTVLGVALLWRASKRDDAIWSGRILVGAMVLGWGLFNVVEGTLDHQLLGIHHVHPGQDELAWDLGFLLFGALEIAIGAVLIRRGNTSR